MDAFHNMNFAAFSSHLNVHSGFGGGGCSGGGGRFSAGGGGRSSAGFGGRSSFLGGGGGSGRPSWGSRAAGHHYRSSSTSSSSSSSTAGRSNRLAREGIAPSTPTERRRSSSSTSEFGSRQLLTQGSGASNLGHGWITPHSEKGRFQFAGLQTMVEGRDSQRYFLCLYKVQENLECLKTARYDLSVQIKCTKTVSAGPNQQYCFSVVFGCQDMDSFFCVTADALAKTWSMRRKFHKKRTPTVLHTVKDEALKANTFYDLLIQVRGHSITLVVNGSAIFKSFPCTMDEKFTEGNKNDAEEAKQAGKDESKQAVCAVGKDGKLEGDVGLVCFSNTKFIFKRWQLSTMDGIAVTAVPRRTGDRTSTVGNGNGASKDGVMTADAHPPKPKPLASATAAVGGGGCGDADRHLVRMVENDILDRALGVSLDDIAALARAKALLSEAVCMPLLVPEFFVGVREPWRGVLLFGPPGTGKTMLAKAVAGMNGSTFFNCSTPSLVSKFRGEGEKICRTLFRIARECAPSVIFIDEIDAMVGARGGDEHEASRRLKSELFVQMDGIASNLNSDSNSNSNSNSNSSPSAGAVMVLAATNCPWHLDEAFRRRLEKRIYIPLPDLLGRAEMFSLHLRNVTIDENIQISTLAELTQSYSGADIKSVCREAAMVPMRRMIAGKGPAEIQELRAAGALECAPITEADFLGAIKTTKPTVSVPDLVRFDDFASEFSAA